MQYHENMPTFQGTCKKDKNAFIEVVLEAENPFQQSGNSFFILPHNMFSAKIM